MTLDFTLTRPVQSSTVTELLSIVILMLNVRLAHIVGLLPIYHSMMMMMTVSAH